MKRLRVTKYGRKPRTARAALVQARDFLVDEGKSHWCKGAVYKPNRRQRNHDGGRITDPDAALCGNWGVCAIGAVALVSGDLVVQKYEWDNDAYVCEDLGSVGDKAIDLLHEVSPDGDIASFNDRKNTKRRDVIRLFDKAIEAAGSRK